MKSIHSTHPRRRSGFSLIEVTIAMAIVAVAVVSLLGMLPRGMQTMQQAGDQAIFGRIHQQILSELQLTSWEMTPGVTQIVDDFDGQIRFYDDQGVEVDGTDDRMQVYAARVHVPPIGSGTRPDSIGGGAFPQMMVGNEPSSDVRTVLVEIAPSASADFDFDDEINFRLINVFQTTLSRLGRNYDS